MRRIIIMALLCAGLSTYGKIRLPNIISSNMVLQQQSKVKLWGASDPFEKIAVTTSWDQKTYQITATNNARWEAEIETPAAGGPYIITLKGTNTIILENILIGEVWVCSGQSNMEMSGKGGLEDIKAALPAAYNPNIRFFHIPKTTALYPQDNCEGQWTVCDSNTLKTFSAVGYFFGKNLNSKLNVPIGLVNASWGGTAAETWTPDSIVNASPVLKEAATKISKAGGRPYITAYAYNGMIAPITNYTIAGTIWYQGENNTGTANTYAQLFTAMIESWRAAWKKDFPFYFVQIAPYKYSGNYAGALLREAQTETSKLSKTGMIVITDLVADTNDVHPTNKRDVGLRLANYALAETYHQEGFAYKSPAFKSMTVKGNKAIVELDNAVVVKGKAVTEILIAGEDKLFYPAQVSIKNNVLTISNKEVKDPVAVRYGFRSAAVGNVFSKEGLPLAPFRTDNWDVGTK